MRRTPRKRWANERACEGRAWWSQNGRERVGVVLVVVAAVVVAAGVGVVVVAAVVAAAGAGVGASVGVG
eukprot:11155574-Lingulodinium_polyedra.AAC.1